MGDAPPRWPVTLHHGAVTLRPLRVGDEAAWTEIRHRGETWFRPWDSTRPPGSLDDSLQFAALVRRFRKRARNGAMLPWAVEYTAPGG